MLRSALAGSGSYYDVVPVSSRFAHSHGGMPITRKFAQGGGSALLAFGGADTMTANAAAASAGSPVSPIDLSSLEGIAGSIFSGALTGPMQIAAAVLLFVAAGKCISRFAGLFSVAGLYFLHQQGVSFGEAAHFVTNFTERAGAAVQAFQTAQV